MTTTDAQGRYVLADVHLASRFAAAIERWKSYHRRWLLHGWVIPSQSGFVMVPVKRVVRFDARTWRDHLQYPGVDFKAKRRSR